MPESPPPRVEDALGGFLEAAPDAMLLVDGRGVITLANAYALELFGWKREELVGQLVEVLVPRAFQAEHPRLRQRFAEQGTARPMAEGRSLRGLHREGTEIPVEISLGPIRLHAGPPHVVVAIRDVTKRERDRIDLEKMRDELEERVRERTRELERVNLRLVEDIAARERAERALSAKLREFEAVSRLGRRALEGLSLDDLIDHAVEMIARSLGVPSVQLFEWNGADQNLVLRAAHGWARTLIGMHSVPEGELSQAGYTLRHGEPVIVENLLRERRFAVSEPEQRRGLVSGLSVTILGSEEPYGVLAAHSTEPRTFTQDDANFLVAVANTLAAAISRNRYQARLLEQESLAKLGAMAAVVAHEVKNPLGGISGAVQIISKKMDPRAPEQAIMEKILERIQTLNATIEDLLAYARPRTPSLRPLDLRPHLESVIALFAQDPEHARVRVEVRADDDGLRVQGDMELLDQVFLNLFTNASQAIDGEGTVTVTATRTGRTCRIRVADDGPGVAPELEGEIFEPFFTTRRKGSGLGLATVRRILERHGGSIRLEKPTPVGGATFTLLLPCAEDSPPPASPRA